LLFTMVTTSRLLSWADGHVDSTQITVGMVVAEPQVLKVSWVALEGSVTR
jgi:hypothetical protein